ncbi:MAG TPA: V-type ATPase 116kDa subunit family protein [Thermoclostridium caenicola]|nr:V-type ATPase 116kDa subunit family protein [Thermoclostridium caenicola]
MKYISIMGPLQMFDGFVLEHIINKDIQIEPSYKAIHMHGLIPFEEDPTYDQLKKRMQILNERIGARVETFAQDSLTKEILEDFDLEETRAYIESLEKRFDQYRSAMASLKTEIQEREQIMKQIQPIAGLNVDIHEMFRFSFMKFRFGSMPKENLEKKKDYLDELDVIYVPVSGEEDIVWLSYFMPTQVGPVIDIVFSALGFERIRISDQVQGVPRVALEKLSAEVRSLREQMEHEEKALRDFIEKERARFSVLYSKVLYRAKINEVRSLAAYIGETFVLVGWMPYREYAAFEKKMESIDNLILSSEDPEYVKTSTPPTLIKNRGVFKPFESFVTLYGLPSTKELDPTKLLALTYILMFGFMFGDVGQGLVIALGGAYLYFFRKMAATAMLIYLGISSAIFGFLYGSVFGNEEIIKPFFISPLHDKDSIMSILLISAVYGVFIILIAIITNIINSYRARNWGRMIFDKNGIAGLMFYGGVIVCVILSLLTGQVVITAAVVVIVVVIPMLMLVFREPLENLIRRRDHIMPREKGMYFVESFFEIFETVLNFFSGTLSFLRVGAFALNHAGLSLAVWTLAKMMSGVGSIIVAIIGNLLTIALEGLIVGIQCLRLEYYEMFGRFYSGEGYEFKPVRVTDD